MSKRITRGILDWTILKYGWLIVFLIHGVFLYMGLIFLRQAYHMEGPTLYTPEQLRISLLLTSIYMVSIAFSLILVILAVFVLEIFRATQKLSEDLDALKDELGVGRGLPGLDEATDGRRERDDVDDTIPLGADRPGL